MIIHFLIKNENLKHGFVEHGDNINSHQHSQKHRRHQTPPAAGHQWWVLADGLLELSAPSDTHGCGGTGWGNWERRWFQKEHSALLHRLQKKKNLFSNCLLHSGQPFRFCRCLHQCWGARSWTTAEKEHFYWLSCHLAAHSHPFPSRAKNVVVRTLTLIKSKQHSETVIVPSTLASNNRLKPAAFPLASLTNFTKAKLSDVSTEAGRALPQCLPSTRPVAAANEESIKGNKRRNIHVFTYFCFQVISSLLAVVLLPEALYSRIST